MGYDARPVGRRPSPQARGARMGQAISDNIVGTIPAGAGSTGRDLHVHRVTEQFLLAFLNSDIAIKGGVWVVCCVVIICLPVSVASPLGCFAPALG